MPISVDVADSEAVDAACDRVEAELGPIDVWVNVAFAGSLAFFWDTTPEGVPADDRCDVLRPGQRGARRPAGDAPAAVHDPVSYVAKNRVATLGAATAVGGAGWRRCCAG